MKFTYIELWKTPKGFSVLNASENKWRHFDSEDKARSSAKDQVRDCLEKGIDAKFRDYLNWND